MDARTAMEHVVTTAQMFGTPVIDEKRRERLITWLDAHPGEITAFVFFGTRIARGEMSVDDLRFFGL